MTNRTGSRAGGPVLPSPDGSEPRIAGLEAMLKAAQGDRPAPVERWDPPYCGDIGLEIRRDGRWHYQGSPIGRMAMVKLFARVLRRDPDGRHYLVTPAEKVDIAVQDAPFLAVEMQVDGGGRDRRLTFRTNVDDLVVVGPAHPLRFEMADGGGLKPYLLVRGRLEALVTRALTFDLVELAIAEPQATGGSRLGVWSGGSFFAIDGAAERA